MIDRNVPRRRVGLRRRPLVMIPSGEWGPDRCRAFIWSSSSVYALYAWMTGTGDHLRPSAHTAVTSHGSAWSDSGRLGGTSSMS